MTEPVPIPAAVAEQARAALAERARLGGVPGVSRAAVVCALELAQAPFAARETLELVGAWHAANPHAVAPDGRCTRLAGLYGGHVGKRWALSQDAVPTVSWLSEESASLAAFQPQNQGCMIALFPDTPEDFAVPGGDPASELHVTLAFCADDAAALQPDDIVAIRDAAAAGARVRSAPLLLSVVGAGTLGDSDPPATVLFVQQDAGDGADHQDGIAAVMAAVRSEMNDYGAETFPPEHDAQIPHLTVGYGTPITDALALVGRQVKFSGGPTVVVGDIREPRAWAGGHAETATVPTVVASAPHPLQVMSDRVNAARRRLEERTMAAAQVAVRDALRRAGVKIIQKASRRSAASKAAVGAAGGKWTGAVLAAAGLTEQDVLRQSFDSLGDRYEAWALETQIAILTAVAHALGQPPDTVVARMQTRVDQLVKDSAARLDQDLTQWSYRLLAEPEPSFGDVGEVPKDATLPRSILAAALAIVGGGAVHPRALDPSAGPVVAQDGLVVEAWAAFDQSPPTEFVTWQHGDTARPFDPHEQLDGVSSSWDDYETTFAADGGSFPYVDFYYEGDHVGCFPAATVVSGPAPSGFTLRWHEGEIIELATASGEFLAATPNHPILTPHGWVRADLLREGDDVIRCIDADRIARLIPGDHNAPAPIEEVVHALRVSGSVQACAVPVTAEDFHGDGIGSEIAVVGTDSQLVFRDKSAFGEPLRKANLVSANADLALVACSGTVREALVGIGDSSLGVMGGGDHRGTLLGGSTRIDDVLLLSRRAEYDSGDQETTGDDPAAYVVASSNLVDRVTSDVGVDKLLGRQGDPAWEGESPSWAPVNTGPPQRALHRTDTDAEAGRELLKRLASAVATDQVVHVERKRFAGHVYNLTDTREGWYMASNLLVHNCSCSTTYSWVDASGNDVAGPDNGSEDAQAASA